MTDRPFDDYPRFLRRNLPIIAIAALLAAIGAFAVSTTQPSKYRASSKILVSADASNSVTANEDPSRVLDTLVKLAKSGEILAYSAQHAGLSRTRLDKATSVTGAPNADVITVSAEAATPELAARYANGLANGFLRWRADRTRAQTLARVDFLRNQLAKLGGQSSPSAVAAASDLRTQLSQALSELQVPSSDLVVISAAKAPKNRFAPSPVRNGFLGLVAGLFLGLALAALRERTDKRIRSEEELESIYDAPVLGQVPFISAARNGNRAAALADLSTATPLADAFRNIRTNVALFHRIEDKTQVVIITSAVPGEGKTTVTANLARAFAAAGQRVLAISADVHSPMLHLVLLPDSSTADPVGIVEVLADKLPLDASVRTHSAPGPSGHPIRVSLLANARRFPDPSILYQSRVMEDVLTAARQAFDVVLIDSPPLLANAESALLATRADGLILVSRTDALTRQQAHHVMRILHASELKPIGIIATGRSERTDPMYGYGYEYGATSGPEHPSSPGRRQEPKRTGATADAHSA